MYVLVLFFMHLAAFTFSLVMIIRSLHRFASINSIFHIVNIQNLKRKNETRRTSTVQPTLENRNYWLVQVVSLHKHWFSDLESRALGHMKISEYKPHRMVLKGMFYRRRRCAVYLGEIVGLHYT